MFKTRQIAGVLAGVGVGVSLLGAGVYASYTDSATATANVGVGSFGCQVSSPGGLVSSDGKSVTVNNPGILSSASGNAETTAMVTNTGSIPAVVHWTEAITPAQSSGLWQPQGDMGYATGSTGNPMSTNITLQPLASSNPYTIGFMWAELGTGVPGNNGNAYLGQPFQVVYTAACSEVPPPVASNISFVGALDGNVTAAAAKKASSVACPVGSPPAGSYPWVSSNANQWCGNGILPVGSTSGWPTTGSFTVTASGGAATIAYTGLTATTFTGVSNTSSATGYVAPGTNNVTQVVPAPSIALPSGSAAGDMAIAYAEDGIGTITPSGWLIPVGMGTNYTSGGYFAVADHVLTAADITARTVVFPAGSHGMVAVYRGVAGIGNVYTTNTGNNQNYGCNPSYDGTLSQPNGSSWVVCIGGDSRNTNPVGFNMATTYGGSAWGTTLRSGGFSDIKVGLADTNGGTKGPFAPPVWASGDYNYGASFGLELLSK
jgi:hypothetical protein